MKKKRFVKLLMAQGIQRNRAAAAARAVSESGNAYKDVYIAMLANPFSIIGRAHWRRVARGFCDGVKQAFRNDAFDAFSYAICALGVAATKAARNLPAAIHCARGMDAGNLIAVSPEQHAAAHNLIAQGYRAGAVIFDEAHNERSGNDD